jgi:hypothetical protein
VAADLENVEAFSTAVVEIEVEVNANQTASRRFVRRFLGEDDFYFITDAVSVIVNQDGGSQTMSPMDITLPGVGGGSAEAVQFCMYFDSNTYTWVQSEQLTIVNKDYEKDLYTCRTEFSGTFIVAQYDLDNPNDNGGGDNGGGDINGGAIIQAAALLGLFVMAFVNIF